jgi:hypothetical protein
LCRVEGALGKKLTAVFGFADPQGKDHERWPFPTEQKNEMYKDENDGKKILVCVVGKTVLHYTNKKPRITSKVNHLGPYKTGSRVSCRCLHAAQCWRMMGRRWTNRLRDAQRKYCSLSVRLCV